MTRTTAAEPRRTRTPSRWRSRSAAWFIALSALAIAVFVPLKYAMSSLETLAANDPQEIAADYVDRPTALQVAFYLHMAFAGLALLLSPLQFATRVRRRVPRLHRVVGRVALGSIAIAGTAGIVIAPGTGAGLAGAVGFGTLGVLWVVFAVLALRAIRRRDVSAHRRWAVRTFALTYAGVTLRLWLSILVPVQMSLSSVPYEIAWDRAYFVVPFLAWIPNLLVAEWYLGRRGVGNRHRRPSSKHSVADAPAAELEGAA